MTSVLFLKAGVFDGIRLLRITQKLKKITDTIMKFKNRVKPFFFVNSYKKLRMKQQKMLDTFAILFVCGILALLITILIVKLADIDLSGNTYFI